MTTPTPDTGDVVGTDAPDLTPEPITDPTHADYVEPFADATPITEEA